MPRQQLEARAEVRVRLARFLVLAIAGTALAASVVSCGGGSGGGSGGMIPPTIQPTLSSIQFQVFTPKCAQSGCHAGTAPQEGLNLSAGQAHSHLVGVPSTQQPTFQRVNPGNATDSYLYMKITADPRTTGARMPEGGAALSAAEITAIRDWINDGAPAN
jgi:hypothetical protein